MTSTTVWTAMPPRMLPNAMARSPCHAALAVIAISGRLVAMASRMTPPSASPRPKRAASTSVVSASLTPATQMVAAEARKIATRIGTGRVSNIPCLAFDFVRLRGLHFCPNSFYLAFSPFEPELSARPCPPARRRYEQRRPQVRERHARAADLRDHLASRRRQDDPDRETALRGGRDPRGGRGARPRRPPPRALRLDGDRAAARNLGHLLGDAV